MLDRLQLPTCSAPVRAGIKIWAEVLTMAYQLPPDIDQRVQSQIALGIYQTPAEVLNDALDVLEQQLQTCGIRSDRLDVPRHQRDPSC